MWKLTNFAICAAVVFAASTAQAGEPIRFAASTAQAAEPQRPGPGPGFIPDSFKGGACNQGDTSKYGMLEGPFLCDNLDEHRALFHTVSDVYKKGFRVTSVYQNPRSKDGDPRAIGPLSIIVERVNSDHLAARR